MKRLLTIQDISCVGQCSTTVALPLISACGVECAILPPAILSNHTGGFKTWSFADLTGELGNVEKKWIEQNIKFDAFYTGYVCENHIDPILSIIGTCSNEGAVRFVDPAMADNGKLYTGFAEDVPSKMARLCDGADYLLPNLTEAAALTGIPYREQADGAYLEDLTQGLLALGAKAAVITGVHFTDNAIGCYGKTAGGETFSCQGEYIPRQFHGTGDIFASAFTGAWMQDKSMEEAVQIASDFTCRSIYHTIKNPAHAYGVKFETALPDLIRALQ
jgi:pyridoxine kinase